MGKDAEKMKIQIMENEKRFDEAAAWIIIGQMLKKPDSVIGLSTGKTTGNMHKIVKIGRASCRERV